MIYLSKRVSHRYSVTKVDDHVSEEDAVVGFVCVCPGLSPQGLLLPLLVPPRTCLPACRGS